MTKGLSLIDPYLFLRSLVAIFFSYVNFLFAIAKHWSLTCFMNYPHTIDT